MCNKLLAERESYFVFHIIFYYVKKIFATLSIFFVCNIFPKIHRSTATWPLDPPKDEKQGWRHVRIKQMGKNASGQTHYLSLSGFELYGTVNGVCEDQLGKERTVGFSNLLKQL